MIDDVITENKYPLCAWHFPYYKGSLCGSQGILKWLWEKCCIKSNFWDEGLNGFHHWRRNDRNLNYDLAIWENKKLPFWVRLMAFLPISRQGKGGQSRTLGSHINICDLLKNVYGNGVNQYFAKSTQSPWHSRNRLGKDREGSHSKYKKSHTITAASCIRKNSPYHKAAPKSV